jgi:hypothetical protein
MPIRPELLKFYSADWKSEVRPRILARAKNCCEECGKPNRQYVGTMTWRSSQSLAGEPQMAWVLRFSPTFTGWRNHRGDPIHQDTIFAMLNPSSSACALRHAQPATVRSVLVVLTVAHLNHIPGDDRDENLKALCGWCHLNYDKLHHAETRATRKDLARPLLSEAC